MKLLIKQRVFSWTDSYDIYDEFGKTKYYAKAELFTFGHQIHIYDMYHHEVGSVHQKILTFLPKFDIIIQHQHVGTVLKEFSFLKPKYLVDYKNWQCHGDFFGWDYSIYHHQGEIAHIYKELFHWGDTYVLDINNPQDELSVLMLAIAIDACNCSQND